MERKHGAWTIKSSECRYRDEFVEFWVDEAVGPDGKPGRRATLRMKPGVSVLALDAEGFVHLVRQFRYAVGRESIEAVMGGADEGEEPSEAARRELREELGIEAAELTDLGLVDAVTSQVLSPSQIFLARGLSFKEPDRDVTESMEPFKVRLGEAVRMVMDGEITQSTSCVLILKASRLLEDEEKGQTGSRLNLR
jgi:8-oxo-dGTP pyrophosphatase MutT (NUDIX family)